MDALAYLFGLEQFGIKLGLDNIHAILDRLGRPERTFRSIHIAGTNGKGSVTAMVDAGLRAAGHRVGRYTSPHLVELSERFVIDGRPVAQDHMIAAISDVRSAVEELRGEHILEVRPTFFEVTTAVAFELFRRSGVEAAVIEVGLGGRLDATNVLLPMATAITSIAIDHQQYLGTTIREIALEKAGIIKEGVPVVIGELDSEARHAIEEVARARAAPVVRAAAVDLGARAVALRGRHQRVNAAIAVELLRLADARGLAVPAPAINAALTDVRWPGRLDERRLPGGRILLMDAAHNAAGAAALAEYLRDERLLPPLVLAAMKDKDVTGIFKALLPNVSSATFTRASNPRSADPSDLAAAARTIAPALPVFVEISPDAALHRAWGESPRVLVAGSIFLLGDVLQRLGLH